ncbi:hypothetical protein ACF1BQ_001275 [Bradyrhizobium sp. RDT10]
MKRAFVFLLAAPVSVFVMVFLSCVALFGGKSADLAALCAMVLAVVTLPASVIAALADGYLRILPISLRAYLTAMVGAAIATGESLSAVQQSVAAINRADARPWRRARHGRVFVVVARL